MQRCRLDHPSRAQPLHRTLRPPHRSGRARPRPRQPVHRRIRRDLPHRGLQDPENADSNSGRQRLRRTLDRDPTPRTPRPHPHLEPATTRTPRRRLHRPLQHPPTTPLTQPTATRPEQIAEPAREAASPREVDPMRRTHQRVSTCRLTSHDTVSGTHRRCLHASTKENLQRLTEHQASGAHDDYKSDVAESLSKVGNVKRDCRNVDRFMN